MIRCEDCAHPMSEGTWEPIEWGHFTPDDERFAPMTDVDGRSTRLLPGRHYSLCDEKCEHGGPGRVVLSRDEHGVLAQGETDDVSTATAPPGDIEASWRPVDVRTLGWPSDLRPERLAVLCRRCLAERGR